MGNHFFAMMSRMKYINRWSLMRNSDNENISEHSLEVAMIAHALAIISNVRFGNDVYVEKAALIGMYHDTTEIITGDMPTPVKYFNPALHGEYEKIEMMARERLLRTLPEEMRPGYKPYVVDMEKDELWPLAKAADTLSAYLKCVEELRAGNHEFKKAHDEIKKKIEDMHCREADWFLNHFAQSFTLTLDEME